MLLFLRGRGVPSICWNILACQVLFTSSQCICAIVSRGRGPIYQSILVSQFIFNSSQGKAYIIFFCGGSLSSRVCSSDKFLSSGIQFISMQLISWGTSVMIYLSVSISTSDFLYQCSNIVIHLLLLIHIYIWIAMIRDIHIYEHGDKKSNLQLKTYHISVICK